MALNGPHSAIAMIIGIKLPLLFKKLQERSFEDLVSPKVVIYNLSSYLLYPRQQHDLPVVFFFFVISVLVLHTCIFTSP